MQTVDTVSGVYILHYAKDIDKNIYSKYRRFGDRRHYVGQSKDIFKRVNQHFTGQGSKCTKAVHDHGIKMTLSAILPIGFVKEEQIITRLGASQVCPLCIIKNKGTQVIIDSKYSVFTASREYDCSFGCKTPVTPGSLAGINKTSQEVCHYFHIRQESVAKS